MRRPFKKDRPPADFDLTAWRERHTRAGDLEQIRYVYDERVIAQLAASLEDQETGLREVVKGVAKSNERFSACLYAIYAAQNMGLEATVEQAANCLIFGQDFPDIAVTLYHKARRTTLSAWHDDLEDPQVFYVDETFALRIACDPRSAHSYLRWPLRDGSWGIVPLPTYLSQVYYGR